MQNRLQSAQGVVAFTESEVQPFLKLPGCLQLRAQGWDFWRCRLHAGAILRWNRIRRWGPQVPSPKQDNRWTAVSLCSAHPAWQSPSGPKHSTAGPGNRSSGHTNYQVLGVQRSDRRLECSCLPSSQVQLQSGQRAANLQGRSMPMQSMAPKEQVTDIPMFDVWQKDYLTSQSIFRRRAALRPRSTQLPCGWQPRSFNNCSNALARQESTLSPESRTDVVRTKRTRQSGSLAGRTVRSQHFKLWWTRPSVSLIWVGARYGFKVLATEAEEVHEKVSPGDAGASRTS